MPGYYRAVPPGQKPFAHRGASQLSSAYAATVSLRPLPKTSRALPPIARDIAAATGTGIVASERLHEFHSEMDVHALNTCSAVFGTFPGKDVRPGGWVRYRRTFDRRRSEFRRSSRGDKWVFLD